MQLFQRALKERLRGKKKRRNWVYVPYDQFTDEIGPLSREDPDDLGIVIVINPWKGERRPYHKQKLGLIVANLRAFALEQAERGVAVRMPVTYGPYRNALGEVIDDVGPLQVMRPAEYELRQDIQPLIESGGLVEVPHEGWLTSPDLLRKSHPNGPPFLLERFYRLARQTYNVLMEGKEPVGGRFNFDAENREAWSPGDPEPMSPPRFPFDAIKQEAIEFIEREYSHHPGELDPDSLPTTKADAQALWTWAKGACLPNFGRFEDAMTTHSSSLFHTRISALLNIGRLLPRQVVKEAEALPVPLASKEGFIRQVLGWREFMHHVHEVTDGFRTTPAETTVMAHPGDGGYARWTGREWIRGEGLGAEDGGAAPNYLGVDTPLPPAYWGATSGMNCLDHVVADVWRDAWSHHITRLMVLSNLATLLDVSPRELTDWFWVAYVDAYDWVVEPNVLGLGTFSTGPLFTTKPYVSGANYIHRMSNYCEGCQFHPKRDCPFISLYWAFLQRHRDLLERNPRLAGIYRSAQFRKGSHQDKYIQIRDTLVRGERLKPDTDLLC